jgi:hypothetical protein
MILKNKKKKSDLYSVIVVVEEEDPTARHLLGLHHGLEVGEQAHVLGHVRRQHHIDHHLTHGHPLLTRQARQDVTVRVLCKSKMSSPFFYWKSL